MPQLSQGWLFIYLLAFGVACKAGESLTTGSGLEEVSTFPKLKDSGDFRYRFQSELDGDDEERVTNRLRVRLGLAADLSPDTTLNFKLTSFTKPESSQASGNFNMGDASGPGFQRRLIGIDQAYVDYHPMTELKVQLGKVPMNLVYVGKSQLLLDSDLALEGVASYSQWQIADGIQGFFNFGYFVVAENFGTSSPKTDETDNTIYTPQLGLTYKSATWQIQGIVSKAAFVGLKGDPLAHTCCGSGVAVKNRGNSEGATAGTYLNDYDLTEYGVEAKTNVDLVELKFFAQGIYNNAVSKNNKASWVGFSLAHGLYSFFYGQSRVEADSVVASFTDADLAKGETDSVGRQMTLQFKVNPYWQLGITKYDSEYRRSLTPVNYRRLSIDSQWLF
jgi:hypothetical protein